MKLHNPRLPLTDVRQFCRKLTKVGLVLTAVGAARPAAAACVLRQSPLKDGTRIELEAASEPLTCRTMSFEAPGDTLRAKASILGTDGRRRAVRKDQIVTTPQGLSVGTPELEVGQTLRIDITAPQPDLTITVGPFMDVANETHVTRTLILDEKHPGWGFADPLKGRTRTERKTIGPDGSRTVELPGAVAQEIVRIAPGSFTLLLPASDVSFTMGPGVTQTEVEGGWRFDAPQGGTLRYCVRRVQRDAVIPDERTFEAGTNYYFQGVSLPEPATPIDLAGRTDLVRLRNELYDRVRELRLAALPTAPALRPRPLNRAWKSGWATPVERGLILKLLLWQNKIPAEMVLTGENPDGYTLTGFDTVLLRSTLHKEIWLDPSCETCAPGEISPRLQGKIALGAAKVVPRQAGSLTRQLSLVGESFRAEFVATGAAALWLREVAASVAPERRTTAMAVALGMTGASVASLEGTAEAGADIHISLVGPSAKDPFPPGETPWEGGWKDIPAAPPPPVPPPAVLNPDAPVSSP